LADSGAYFAGQRFGRHKLAPVLSPKKTWEGYFGGVIVAVLGGVVIGLVSPLGVVQCAIAAFLVGALGTLGDLAESMFKRQANAKDSGHLIPGHGGAFDRIDSLLWAGVVVYYFATLTATFLH
jgi:phosphatidate cytidylyltransferase